MTITSRSTTPRTDYSSLIQNYSTEELAAILCVKPQTIRHGLCTKGHYFKLTPLKLPNRRLAWPRADVERLLAGGVQK
jgi:hypothetical protein